MATILPVVTGAILTAVLGNFLVQRWQLRGWRAQQRQLGHQAELEELKRLVEELTTKATSRLNSMRRLTGSLSPTSVIQIENPLAEYRSEVADWNISLNPFYVRLRLYLNYEMTLRLESEIHDRFVEAGRLIEAAIRQREAGHIVSWTRLSEISTSLNEIQGSLWRFFRDLMDKIEARRDELYYGRKLPYSKGYIAEYSRFELVKALFTNDVDGFYVIRTP